jgi:hypothetical protein
VERDVVGPQSGGDQLPRSMIRSFDELRWQQQVVRRYRRHSASGLSWFRLTCYG